jgi:hypothetical protein
MRVCRLRARIWCHRPQAKGYAPDWSGTRQRGQESSSGRGCRRVATSIETGFGIVRRFVFFTRVIGWTLLLLAYVLCMYVFIVYLLVYPVLCGGIEYISGWTKWSCRSLLPRQATLAGIKCGSSISPHRLSFR